jgi:hypothetical protein
MNNFLLKLTTNQKKILLNYIRRRSNRKVKRVIKNNINEKKKSKNEDKLVCLNKESKVNIINNSGNKYVFNDNYNYNPSLKYTLNKGNYQLLNVPIEHPIAILNINKESKINLTVQDKEPIIIKVKGGKIYDNGEDFYNFFDKDNNPIEIRNGNFRFMKNRTYRFIDVGISRFHPFSIIMNGNILNDFNKNNNITYLDLYIDDIDEQILYYQCEIHSNMKGNMILLSREFQEGFNGKQKLYNFFYGDVNINVKQDFDSVSILCYYHGYMGGEKLFKYSSKC